ncbi:class I adenylate-forming enzyme family protein [Altererythrobacter sp. MF3-039]|uniref:class I adenylate-forming enzyme family protein n=1 Tax=Altererythrobacter sp. MF3-039 TaxID=3252901 RepID=UPI00390C5A09
MYNVKLTESHFPAQTDTPFREMTIAGLLREQAEKCGDIKALREILPNGAIGREWTFAELRDDCERLGRVMAVRHAAGARIAIYAMNCPEWVIVQYAAALAGLSIVTVNPAYIPRELRYVMEQSGAEAIYHGPDARGTPLRPIIDEACGDLDTVGTIIDISDNEALHACDAPGELRETDHNHILQIQYTSGTTGFPKGVLLRQGAVLQNGADMFARWNFQAGEEEVLPTPLFHAAASAQVFAALVVGGTITPLPFFDPVMMIEVIEREQPEFVGGVPTMLVMMIDEVRRSGRKMQGAKALMSGAAMVAPDLARNAEEVFGAPIQVVYGQTEASPVITMGWRDDNDVDRTQTIGQPLSHMEVSIRDVNDNSVCPLEVQGEICVRGYNVMAGYNDNPEATSAAIDEEGWLHSGDLGTIDARGFVKITGRVKEMIIRGGENLFPAEIENAMIEHPAIAEVAVAGIPDKKWGEQVACFMRKSEGVDAPSPGELKAYVRERLSPQKTPFYWVWVDEYPLTGSGKIQKFELSKAFVDGKYEALTA